MASKRTAGRLNRIAVLVLSLFITQPLWADVRAQLSRDTIYDGDTVTLIIESTEPDPGGQPELSKLEQDFEILGTSSSQQVQIINGRRSEKHQWQVELAPRRSGTLGIPAIRVGSAETRALELEVREQPAAAAAGVDQPVFVRTTIEPEDGSVFVQQQIGFSVQLYFSVPLSEGSFDVPALEHAAVEQLGEDTQYRTTLNGRQYQVVERRYAIFPEQSGPLTIPAVTFTGRARSATSGRSPFLGMDEMMDRFFSSGDRGQRVRVRSEPLTIDVKPRPDDYTGTTWLPSERFVLRDSWTQGPPEFRVGEPVTRTIEIMARGLAASQLPDLDIQSPAGMRLYPEAPQRENRTDGDAVLGSSSQAFAYVPATAGRVKIPEVRLEWWDVRSQQQQTALLPAWEVTVSGAPGAAPQSPAPPVAATPPAGTGPEPMMPAATVAGESEPGLPVTWLAGTALGVLLLVAVLLYRMRSRHRAMPAPAATAIPEAAPGTPRPQTASAAAAELQQACMSNDPAAAARALLHWAAARWPEQPPTSLGALAQRVGSGAAAAVRELDQALYAPVRQAWQGRGLWETFEQGMDDTVEPRQVDRDELSPLYPERHSQSVDRG